MESLFMVTFQNHKNTQSERHLRVFGYQELFSGGAPKTCGEFKTWFESKKIIAEAESGSPVVVIFAQLFHNLE